MGTNKAKRLSTLERRSEVSRLYREGWTVAEIAAHQGKGISTIYDDLEIIRKVWLQRIADDFEALQAEELAKIDRIEREANESWNESEKTPADGKFLDIASNCIKRRVAILGLDDPAKFGSRAIVSGKDKVMGVVLVEVTTREQAVQVMSFDEAEKATVQV